ncbi:MAG: hypothetical protein ACKOED_02000 [Aestuariivirga sp.]|uniref:hypothetical protein n=1 Tax=Aestuariivirga sp. TaxID=2650926 RepID=UPI0038D15ED6
MTKSKLLASLLIAASAMGASVAAEAGSLGKGEVAKLFPGQFEAKVKGYRVAFSGERNGALSGEAYGQQDQGHWYMKGAELCVVWTKWTDGKPRCGEVSQQGGWYVAHDGKGEMLKFRRTDVAQN